MTVLNRGALALACADPGAVYEGSADVAFDCSASGAPGGSSYSYAWRARGGTSNTDLLSATDGPAPTFEVPDALDETTTYEYLLTVSAANAEDAAAEVTVTVLNSEALARGVRGSRRGVRGVRRTLPWTARLRALRAALLTSMRGRPAAVRRTRTCSALRTVPRRRSRCRMRWTRRRRTSTCLTVSAEHAEVRVRRR